MTIVAGYDPDSRAASGLRLAGQLAVATGEEVVVCSVLHDPFDSAGLADFAGVDAEWRRQRTETVSRAVEDARSQLPAGVKVSHVVRSGRSAPRILQEEAAAQHAGLLVTGSAAGAEKGRIALGSATDRLVHSCQAPVAIAPRGYRPGDQPVRRLVAAVNARPYQVDEVGSLVSLAGRLRCSVELVTFHIAADRDPVGDFANRAVFDYWRSQVESMHEQLADAIPAKDPDVHVHDGGLVSGPRWRDAVDAVGWQPGDLLVIGSSEHSRLAAVFLGSTATRIIRHSPVPTILLAGGGH